MIDEVDQHLGYPALDPHGSPIPADRKQLDQALWNEANQARVLISNRQADTQIIKKLWELGLMPGEIINVIGRESDTIKIISAENEEIVLSRELAEQIYTTSE